MKAFDCRVGLVVLVLLGLAACSTSNSPLPTDTAQKSRGKVVHQDDSTTKQIVHLTEPVVSVEELVEEYSDGTTRRTSEAYLDEQGNRILHGAVAEFYPNGSQFSAGRYAHGKRDGQWTFWHQGGGTARIARFDKGVAEGQWIWYRTDGTLSREASYAAGKLDGASISYAEDGKSPLQSETYLAGRRHGLVSRWYETGQKAVQIEFKDGIPHGREIRWHLNGLKRAEGQHRDGSPHGVFNYWTNDGTPIKSIQWQNGRRVSRLMRRERGES